MQNENTKKPLTSKQLLAFKKRYGTEPERFWKKAIKHPEGCWEWIGGMNEHGYGIFEFRGGSKKAHRVAWIWANGEIPNGLFVLHKCDNPACIRPDHCFLGTQKDNMGDASRKGRIPRGEARYQSKLTEKQVLEIRKNYKRNARVQVAESKKYGISIITYRHIVYNRGWKHLIPADA